MVDFWFYQHFHFQRATQVITIRGVCWWKSRWKSCQSYFYFGMFSFFWKSFDIFCFRHLALLLAGIQESESEKSWYFVVGTSSRKLQNSHCPFAVARWLETRKRNINTNSWNTNSSITNTNWQNTKYKFAAVILPFCCFGNQLLQHHCSCTTFCFVRVLSLFVPHY